MRGRRNPIRGSNAASACLALALLGTPFPARAADQAAAACDAAVAAPAWPRLAVTVTGARPVAGSIAVTVYGERAARFLAHHGALAVVRVPLHAASAEACVAVSSPGTYAIAVYHDANDNRRFDRTLLGLPAEGYGFSNDAPALLGLPAFASVRFAVPAAGSRFAIRLRY